MRYLSSILVQLEQWRIKHHPPTQKFLSGDSELVIVSGADRRYYLHAHRFLLSVSRYEAHTKMVFYDLGLEQYQLDDLQTSFPSVDFRTFDYTKYPSHFNMQVVAGKYAWKPIIIYNTLHEFKTNVFWLDAGCIIIEPLKWVRVIVDSYGFYSPRSDADIEKWTHPSTLDYLNVSHDLRRVRNLASGIVGLNYHNPQAIEIAHRWQQCALIKECIAPAGSSHHNHRYDQAILSIIARQIMGTTRFSPGQYHGVDAHINHALMKQKNARMLKEGEVLVENKN